MGRALAVHAKALIIVVVKNTRLASLGVEVGEAMRKHGLVDTVSRRVSRWLEPTYSLYPTSI